MSSGASAAQLPSQNELLCFMHDKCKSMTFNDVVKICSDFYREKQVLAAKALTE